MDINKTVQEVSAVQYNEIVRLMMDDEKTMSEVVVALHTDIPLIEHGLLIRAIMSRDPVDLLCARAVIDSAISAAADNRAKRLQVLSLEL